jgi:transposase
MRIPFCKREKAAYAILRRKGLSINQISKAFGRSTSVIHRALTRLEKHGHNKFVNGSRIDIRKLPYRVRMALSVKRWKTMMKQLGNWETWILGDGVEPP